MKSVATLCVGVVLALSAGQPPSFAQEPAIVLKEHKLFANSLAFSPDSQLLASGGYRPEFVAPGQRSPGDSDILLWDVKAKERVATLSGHGKTITSLAFSPDGRCLASCSEDGTVRIWDVVGKKEVMKISETGRLSSVVYHPNGQAIAYGGFGATIWDLAEGKTRKAPDVFGEIRSLCFSPCGKYMVACDSKQSVLLLDGSTGKKVAVLQQNDGSVGTREGRLGAVFHPNGRSVIAMDIQTPSKGGRNIGGWDVQKHSNLSITLGLRRNSSDSLYFGVDDLACHPEGKMLAAIDGSILWVWPLETTQYYSNHSPIKNLGQKNSYRTVSFSPDSAFLAASSSDGAIRLWSLPLKGAN